MKLLIFSKWSFGGLSTFFNQIDKLKEKGIYCKYFLFQPPNDLNKYKNLDHKVIYPYLKFKSDAFVFLPLKFFYFLKDLIKTFIILRNELEKESIVLVCDLYSLVLLSMLKNFLRTIFGVNFKIFFHVNIYYKYVLEKRSFFVRKIIISLSSYFFKKIDYCIFVSKDLVKPTFLLFDADDISIKYTVIYHGVLMSNKIIKNPRLFLKHSPVILFVGRLEPQKDIETIIYAFSIIIKSINAKLWLVGDGRDRRKLEYLVNNLGLKPYVKFWGWQDNVEKFYQRADLFVFASNSEGFGYVIIEAMSNGLPVISTDTPYGPAEILGYGKYGILVPMKNYKEIAKWSIKLLRDRGKYRFYSKMSLIRAKYFSEKKMLDKYKKLFIN